MHSGFILLVYRPQNANGTNMGAPEQHSNAFWLTLTTVYYICTVYENSLYVH